MVAHWLQAYAGKTDSQTTEDSRLAGGDPKGLLEAIEVGLLAEVSPLEDSDPLDFAEIHC